MSLIRVCRMLLLLFCCVGAESPRHFTFTISTFECFNYTSLLKTFDCTFHQQAKNLWIFEQRIKLSRDLNKYEVRQRIDVMLVYAKTQLKVLDLRIDVCQGLDVVWRTPLLRVLLSELRRTSNIPTACPWKANKLYKLQNFTVSSTFFPPYSPDGDFNFTTDYFEDGIMFANQIVKGKVSSKRFSKG